MSMKEIEKSVHIILDLKGKVINLAIDGKQWGFSSALSRGLSSVLATLCIDEKVQFSNAQCGV